LFGAQPFEQALASFLRLIFGLQPSRHFDAAPPPWKDAYEKQYPERPAGHQITILDLSQLASEVLENVTALIGRLILEFMQRNPDRGKLPVVLVLEEAHHYIPANARLERQQRAREVFEKIAQEGRKFGLSLVVASQRPSELSRTVLAQCNSFIVRRFQNPDDQEYFKSVLNGAGDCRATREEDRHGGVSPTTGPPALCDVARRGRLSPGAAATGSQRDDRHDKSSRRVRN